MINKIIYIALTILIIIGSCLAGVENNHNTVLYDLYNQECWVGFCIMISLLLFDLKQTFLGILWLVLLAASTNELIEQYTNINDGDLKGADYINTCFIILASAGLIYKALFSKNHDNNHARGTKI